MRRDDERGWWGLNIIVPPPPDQYPALLSSPATSNKLEVLKSSQFLTGAAARPGFSSPLLWNREKSVGLCNMKQRGKNWQILTEIWCVILAQWQTSAGRCNIKPLSLSLPPPGLGSMLGVPLSSLSSDIELCLVLTFSDWRLIHQITGNTSKIRLKHPLPPCGLDVMTRFPCVVRRSSNDKL